MAIKSRTWLKSRFENGDTPSEREWYDVFDSFVHKIEDDSQLSHGGFIKDDQVALDTTWSSSKIQHEIQNGNPIRKTVVSFTNATTVTIDHGFDTFNVIYKSYFLNSANEMEEFIPGRFRLINSNTAVADFNPSITGFIILTAI